LAGKRLSKGEVFLLPLAKGGGEGFYEALFKVLKCYKNSRSGSKADFVKTNFSGK
jgi:hypothetical protein